MERFALLAVLTGGVVFAVAHVLAHLVECAARSVSIALASAADGHLGHGVEVTLLDRIEVGFVAAIAEAVQLGLVGTESVEHDANVGGGDPVL